MESYIGLDGPITMSGLYSYSQINIFFSFILCDVDVDVDV